MDTSAPTLAITGATGFIGGRVAEALAHRGIALRLIVRNADRAPTLAGATIAIADYSDQAAARHALDGVHTLFMVSGTESADRLDAHRSFIDAAVGAGVQRIVYLSFFGAAPEATFTLARDHWHTEERIRRSGVAYTFLRDNLYADFLPFMVGEDGVIRGPAGTGHFAPVARRDVADVAVEVLTAACDAGLATSDNPRPLSTGQHRSPHDDRTYHLTGPDLMTVADVAAVITKATGRHATYRDETESEAFESRASYGAPDWQVRAWVSTYQAIAAGELAPVTGDVESVIGRPPVSLADLLAEFPHPLGGSGSHE
jgi:uncharacterized protein YbjT (DUF2867 family)